MLILTSVKIVDFRPQSKFLPEKNKWVELVMSEWEAQVIVKLGRGVRWTMWTSWE